MVSVDCPAWEDWPRLGGGVGGGGSGCMMVGREKNKRNQGREIVGVRVRCNMHNSSR